MAIINRQYPSHFDPYIDAFIDNSGNEEHEGIHRDLQVTEIQDVHDMYDDNYESLLARAHNHSNASAGPHYCEEDLFQNELVIGLPGIDDYPLWRVDCRVRRSSSLVICSSVFVLICITDWR